MKPTRDYLKTKEVLDATGITHQMLYRYVTMGLVEEIDTRGGGHRVFPPQTVPAIKLIRRLNQSGYTLRDIKDIFFKEGRLDSAPARLDSSKDADSDVQGDR